jgi:hypothetical protein
MLTITFSLLLTLAYSEDQQAVIVPKDSLNSFTVQMTDIVRIPASGIAGTTFNFKVEGPAELVRVNNVIELTYGKPLLGNVKREAVIKPTGTGKVKVIATSKSPTSEKEATLNYNFEVK